MEILCNGLNFTPDQNLMIPIQSIGLKWLQIDIESIGIGSDIIEHVNKSMKRRANDELAEC